MILIFKPILILIHSVSRYIRINHHSNVKVDFWHGYPAVSLRTVGAVRETRLLSTALRRCHARAEKSSV